jgi:hypothetical protein
MKRTIASLVAPVQVLASVQKVHLCHIHLTHSLMKKRPSKGPGWTAHGMHTFSVPIRPFGRNFHIQIRFFVLIQLNVILHALFAIRKRRDILEWWSDKNAAKVFLNWCTYLTRACNCPSHGVVGDGSPRRFVSWYVTPKDSGLTICNPNEGIQGSEGGSSGGGGVAASLAWEATPANICAAASSSSFRFPHAAGDGSGNLDLAESWGATIDSPKPPKKPPDRG